MKRQLNTQAEKLGRLRLEVGELRGRNAMLTDGRDRLTGQVDELLIRLEHNSLTRTRGLKSQLREGIRTQLITKPTAFELELKELLELELLFDETDGEDDPELLYLG